MTKLRITVGYPRAQSLFRSSTKYSKSKYTSISISISSMNISTERNPGISWKRLLGRPRKPWTSRIPDGTGMSSRAYWDASIRRGHGRGTLRSLKTTRWWWWRWWYQFYGVQMQSKITCRSRLSILCQNWHNSGLLEVKHFHEESHVIV